MNNHEFDNEETNDINLSRTPPALTVSDKHILAQLKRLTEHNPPPQHFGSSPLYLANGNTRYYQLGIVTFHEPLNLKNNKKRYLAIYDNVLQEILKFDVQKLYKNYVMKGIDRIKTINGEFAITETTRELIKEYASQKYEFV